VEQKKMKDADPETVRKYVEAAENQYRSIEDPGYLLVRPLSDFSRTPIYFYRVGVLLSALEAGFHDVLEFGAGTCWLGIILYRLGSRVTFLEVSSTALGLGEKLMRQLEPVQSLHTPPRFLTYDGFTFPLDDESMDRIVCHDALHHIPNPGRIIGEMYRVLRPGGKVAFAEPGEGHSEAEASKEDMKKYGVLEADVHFEALRDIAKETGFSKVFFKPFPKIETLTLTDKKYLAFQNGKNNVFPFDEIRRDLKYFQTIVLTKGPAVVDTRYPYDTRAKIEILKKPSDFEPEKTQPWKVRYTNIGDTTWLSPLNNSTQGEEDVHKGGGYVWIRVLLKNADGELIDLWYYSCPLPKDIHPKERIKMSLDIPTPKKQGRYIFEFDLEARGHFMFSDNHVNPYISESVKVPIEVS